MANPLPPPLASGTLGEIFVQLRLLQFGVQAAPPIKDTGNDLVAFHGRTVRTIQVKTSTNRISKDRRLPRHYDILALVLLHSADGAIALDSSRIFLVPYADERNTSRSFDALSRYELLYKNVASSIELLDRLFDFDRRI